MVPGGRGKRRGRRPAIRDPFVRWLEADRLTKHMTRRAYAAQFGISGDHWSNICADRRQLQREHIEIISGIIAGAGDMYRDLHLTQASPEGI